MKKVLFFHTLKQLSLSQTAWWLAAIGLIILGTIDYKLIQDYLSVLSNGLLANGTNNAGLTDDIVRPLMGYTLIYFILAIPLVCLQILGFDKQIGMTQFLHTCPISPKNWILGKYLGTFSYLLMLQALFASMTLILLKGNQLDMGLFWSDQLALFLINMSLLALGFLISSLFSNPTLAVAVNLILNLVLLMLPWFSPAFAELSLSQHTFGLLHGQVNTEDLGFFILITFLALCFCIKLNQLENAHHG
jgi:ABC-2 type transport system permease protein